MGMGQKAKGWTLLRAPPQGFSAAIPIPECFFPFLTELRVSALLGVWGLKCTNGENYLILYNYSVA